MVATSSVVDADVVADVLAVGVSVFGFGLSPVYSCRWVCEPQFSYGLGWMALRICEDMRHFFGCTMRYHEAVTGPVRTSQL